MKTYDELFDIDEYEIKKKIPHIPLRTFHDFLKSSENIIKNHKFSNNELCSFKNFLNASLSNYVIAYPFSFRYDNLTTCEQCFIVSLSIEDIWNFVVLKSMKSSENNNIYLLPSTWEFVDIEVGKINNTFDLCCWI